MGIYLPETYYTPTKDNESVRLTRIKGGEKGPVILAHGLGVSGKIFTTNTIKTNLANYLAKNSYDVWILDLRFSIELESSKKKYSADESALFDYPAAIDKVREITKRESVQVVAHCYGSVAFSMAMLAGLQGVRSAVCSQVSTHVSPPRMTTIKSRMRVAGFIRMLGIQNLTAATTRRAGGWSGVMNALLKLYPVPWLERCNNPVCSRVAFLYAPLYKHSQIADQTHEHMNELFGTANLSAFRHLDHIVRRGFIVDRKGNNVYLPNLEKMAIPIRFIHGGDNICFYPESTEITYNLLKEKNGAALYSRRVIPGYNHIDCIFGRYAYRDVFPEILEHLEQTQLNNRWS